MLEYLDDAGRSAPVAGGDVEARRHAGGAGAAVPGLFGTVDRTMGHKRRFRKAELANLLEGQGFRVERVYSFNKVGAPPWWVYSRLLRREQDQQADLEDLR